MFGSDSDDEEAAAALAAQMKANKDKAEKQAPMGRSLIVLDVKPYDAETDLVELAKGIKALTHEGIQNWGAEHKFEPIAFGIKKLVISLVVYDKLMGVDDITDLIEGKYEDDVQSIDVAAMSKV